MRNDQLYIYYCNLHGIPSLTTPAVSSILMSTDNTTSSKHNYDELLNIHQYFPHHNIVLYATLYTFSHLATSLYYQCYQVNVAP